MRRAFLVPILLLAAAPGVASQAEEALPEGCVAEGTGFLCEWDYDTSAAQADAPAAPAGSAFSTEIPVRERMLATVTVRMEGRDLGWTVTVVSFLNVSGEDAFRYSRMSHNAPADTNGFHSETAVFLMEAPRGIESRHYLGLVTGYVEANEFAVSRASPAPGRYHVVYAAEALPEGEVPARPAATQADPHLQDLARDARRGEYDLLDVWLDDARVGDRLFDAHLRVADLTEILLPVAPDGSRGYVLWSLPLRVLDTDYEMRWFAGPGDNATAALGCNFRRGEGQANPIIGFPACTFDRANGTMHAVIPEGFVGSPSAGEPIALGTARVVTSAGPVANVVEDESSNHRYDFALGGPEVWSPLNPRLDPRVERLAWYQDPLASENIPDTLSVAGAALATLTFLGGALVVQRNRRRTREILDKVDALVRAHERDSNAALVALGTLEAEFTDLYRRGRMNESQYQLAQQRIVAAASRLALRKELGLDDGTPG